MNSSLPVVVMQCAVNLVYHTCVWIPSLLVGESRGEPELLKMTLSECGVGEAEKGWLTEMQDQSRSQGGWRDSMLKKDFYIFQEHPVEKLTERDHLSVSGKLHRHTASPWKVSPGPHLTWRKRDSPRTDKVQQFPRSVPNSPHLSPTKQLPVFLWQRRGRKDTGTDEMQQLLPSVLLCPLLPLPSVSVAFCDPEYPVITMKALINLRTCVPTNTTPQHTHTHTHTHTTHTHTPPASLSQ